MSEAVLAFEAAVLAEALLERGNLSEAYSKFLEAAQSYFSAASHHPQAAESLHLLSQTLLEAAQHVGRRIEFQPLQTTEMDRSKSSSSENTNRANRDFSNLTSFVNVGGPTQDPARASILELELKRAEAALTKLSNENARLRSLLEATDAENKLLRQNPAAPPTSTFEKGHARGTSGGASASPPAAVDYEARYWQKCKECEAKDELLAKYEQRWQKLREKAKARRSDPPSTSASDLGESLKPNNQT